MKNYAAIIIALTAYDLSGQALGLNRFLFEPVIRPYDWRPPEDFNATRARGSHHGVDNRVTPNVHGNPSAYGFNPVDFNSTIDQNARTYNMAGGQIYNGPDLPVARMALGNPHNNLSERWHTPYSPDYVRGHLGTASDPGARRFTPPDNRYNPNLTLHGTLAESPWEYYASPQISMANPLNNIRDMFTNANKPNSGPRLLQHLPTDLPGVYVNDNRLTSLTWDTLGHDILLQCDFNNNQIIDPIGEGDLQYEFRSERWDSMEQGSFYQDGMAVSGNTGGFFQCGGHLLPTPLAHTHSWEKRHFSSLSRAGMDAKRSIPMDGIRAFIDDQSPANPHWFHRGGGKLPQVLHWAYPYGNNNYKPIFNVGWAWVRPVTMDDGGSDSGAVEQDALGTGLGTVDSLENCTWYNNPITPALFSENERYGATGTQAGNTGNNVQNAAAGGPYAPFPGTGAFRVTGTTSSRSNGLDQLGNPIAYVDSVAELDGTNQLAGHPLELAGSSLSPWNPSFGYDLSRFFGDFYVEPSVWTFNSNPAGNVAVSTGVTVGRIAGQNNGFMSPIDPKNQVSTRSLAGVLKMGDYRQKIRHINRFPTATIDYLFQSNFNMADYNGTPPNQNMLPVYTQ